MWLVTAIFNIYMLFEEIPLLARFCKRYIRKYFPSVPFFLHGCVSLYERRGSPTVN